MTRSTRRTPGVRTSRTSEVQQRVKALILERGLAAGDPMPTEVDLMEELDVSRNSLREALKALQAVGIVEIRHGFGTYVGHRSLGALVDELTFHGRMSLGQRPGDLAHLVQIREVLERGLVEQVLRAASESDLARLGDVMARMEAEAADGEVSPEVDRLFHEVLYEPLHNPLVSQLLGAFWDVHHELQRELGPVGDPAGSVAERHRVIYEAVRAGDAAAAVRAMTVHFDGIRGRLTGLPD
ncbi:FadR/GntR family transcriptional regulator [Streptomyces sp. NRRL F-5126]|uniref:FadR/GntR family transcriptional regulator n=1 Tax=Streptomyces sp. NRRL F-5126 TaxID=1463857 RepID=UPI0004C83498|nr:FCD domain-containing protein [Streptomyces sp. NRRL F-5126]